MDRLRNDNVFMEINIFDENSFCLMENTFNEIFFFNEEITLCGYYFLMKKLCMHTYVNMFCTQCVQNMFIYVYMHILFHLNSNNHKVQSDFHKQNLFFIKDINFHEHIIFS